MDEGISSFGDALWYCFATVTTIGYGDVTSVTAIGRVLSVILGIYGIVVVALITSIIVNFYNEMKSEKPENIRLPRAESGRIRKSGAEGPGTDTDPQSSGSGQSL